MSGKTSTSTRDLARKAGKTVHSYGIKPLDHRVGSVITGNPNGLIPEFAGRFSVAKSRALSNYEGDDRSVSEEVEQLRTKGYVDLGKVYEDSLVEKVQSKFDEMIQDEDVLLDWDPDEYEETFLKAVGNEMADRIPEIGEFIVSDVGRIVSEYYQSHFQVRQCYCYRNFHVPPEIPDEVYANFWHVDHHTSDHLKLFVNLTDVEEKHGPFHVIDREDTARLARKHLYWDRSEEGIPNREVEHYSDVETFTGPKGSVMLANTHQVLHRAGVPDEGLFRDFFQFILAPSSKPLSYDWIDGGLPGITGDHFRRPIRY